MVIARVRSWFCASHKREAQLLYIALVRQSRKPFFYVDCGVADTLDGRFDVILLHMFLALYHLGGHAAQGVTSVTSPLRGRQKEFLRVPTENKQMARLLQECFFADMDRSLREIGVGDMGVGKRIKTMSKAAFGRLEAYTQSFDSDAALRDALVRNIYRGGDVKPAALDALMKYVREYAPPL